MFKWRFSWCNHLLNFKAEADKNLKSCYPKGIWRLAFRIGPQFKCELIFWIIEFNLCSFVYWKLSFICPQMLDAFFHANIHIIRLPSVMLNDNYLKTFTLLNLSVPQCTVYSIQWATIMLWILLALAVFNLGLTFGIREVNCVFLFIMARDIWDCRGFCSCNSSIACEPFNNKGLND